MISSFFANIISILHLTLIFYILHPLFIALPIQFIFIHPLLCCLILLHWTFSNNYCALTLLEQYCRGIQSDESFIHNIVAPVYDYNPNHETEWMTLLVLFCMLVGLYQIYERLDEIQNQKIVKLFSSTILYE